MPRNGEHICSGTENNSEGKTHNGQDAAVATIDACKRDQCNVCGQIMHSIAAGMCAGS